jgi:DNA-binding HxlR family transcriptional regulator
MLSFEIGSVATLERRLARLKRLGIVVQARSDVDKRNVELKLSPRVNRIFQRYSALIASNHDASGAEHSN